MLIKIILHLAFILLSVVKMNAILAGVTFRRNTDHVLSQPKSAPISKKGAKTLKNTDLKSSDSKTVTDTGMKKRKKIGEEEDEDRSKRIALDNCRLQQELKKLKKKYEEQEKLLEAQKQESEALQKKREDYRQAYEKTQGYVNPNPMH